MDSGQERNSEVQKKNEEVVEEVEEKESEPQIVIRRRQSIYSNRGDSPFEKYRIVKMQEKQREAQMLMKYQQERKEEQLRKMTENEAEEKQYEDNFTNQEEIQEQRYRSRSRDQKAVEIIEELMRKKKQAEMNSDKKQTLLKQQNAQLKKFTMLKTNLCMAHQNQRKCKYQRIQCPFAHGKSDLREPGQLINQITLQQLKIMLENGKQIKNRDREHRPFKRDNNAYRTNTRLSTKSEKEEKEKGQFGSTQQVEVSPSQIRLQ